MKTDLCKCGESKDCRAIRCRKCVDLEKAAQPCKGCGKCEPEVSFGKRYYKCTRNGRGWKRRSRCKECEADYAKAFRKTNPEEHKRRKKSWEKRNPDKVYKMGQRSGWKSLGLDPIDIEKRLSNHDGLCEICRQPPDLYKRLSADHSHTTKKFRGFLCYRCNLGIGQFNDNTDLLMKAIDYLNRHNQEPSDNKVPSHNLTI